MVEQLFRQKRRLGFERGSVVRIGTRVQGHVIALEASLRRDRLALVRLNVTLRQLFRLFRGPVGGNGLHVLQHGLHFGGLAIFLGHDLVLMAPIQGFHGFPQVAGFSLKRLPVARPLTGVVHHLDGGTLPP